MRHQKMHRLNQIASLEYYSILLMNTKSLFKQSWIF